MPCMQVLGFIGVSKNPRFTTEKGTKEVGVRLFVDNPMMTGIFPIFITPREAQNFKTATCLHVHKGMCSAVAAIHSKKKEEIRR